MPGYVNVLCLSEEDRKVALDCLRGKGAQESGSYVFGLATDKDIEVLEKAGLSVETIPAEESLGWLEPLREVLAATTVVLSADKGESAALEKLADKATDTYILQMPGPLQPTWQAAFDGAGVQLGGWVSGNGVKVQLNPEQKEAVEAMPFVRRVVLFSPELTLRRLIDPKSGDARRAAPDPESMLEMTRELAMQESDGLGMAPPPVPEPDEMSAPLYMFDIKCHRPENLKEVEAVLLDDTRINRLESGRIRIRIWVGEPETEAVRGLLAEIGKLPQVSVVEPYEYPTIQNSVVRRSIGIAGPPPDASPQFDWDGSGQVVGVSDTGVQSDHPDLIERIDLVIERVEVVRGGDRMGHGTHVCGTICGDGSASGGQILGMAPGARLIVQTLNNGEHNNFVLPVDLGELFEQAYDAGARIQNASWGDRIGNGLFSTDAEEIDHFIHTHPDCLVVIAAGNTGQQDTVSLDGSSRPMKTGTLSSTATAKNALTVGACCSPRTDGPYVGRMWSEFDGRTPSPQFPPFSLDPINGNVEVLAAFSGRGPTDSDQVKPDLVAPGTAILSTRSEASNPAHPHDGHDGRYCYDSGTSMAAPVVTGAAAVVRQYYVEHRNHAVPSAALLKATLINGTVWLGWAGAHDPLVGMPNYYQGHGRLNLSGTIPRKAPEDGFALAFVDIPTASPASLNKAVSSRAMWRKVLKVQEGLPLHITLAWTDFPQHGLDQNLDLLVIAPDGRKITGNEHHFRPPHAKADRNNNVETVRIETPAGGDYLVHVICYNTPRGDQGFSLVATGKLAVESFI